MGGNLAKAPGIAQGASAPLPLAAMWLRAFPATLLAVLGGACATWPTPEQSEARAKRIVEIAHVREVDPVFAARGRVLVDGFPEAIADEGFWPGDRLLFGVESFAGEEVQRYYLLFECAGAETRSGEVELLAHDKVGAVTRRTNVKTGFAPVQVTLLDENLQELRCATSQVAREVHEIDMFPYVYANRAGGRLPRTLATPRTRRPLILFHTDWGAAITGCLLDELLDNGAMRDLASRLSISPGWFEAIGFLGQQMTLNFGLRHPLLVPQPIDGLLAGEQALECATSICGKQMILVVNVVMVPSVGPLVMTGGVVTLTGYRCQEPDRRFVVRLLGVARGVQPGR